MKQDNDQSTPVNVLKEAIRQFVAERQWEKYHDPKNLAMSIGIEAGELMQVFQWLSPSNAKRITKTSKRGQQVVEELADVLIYCLMLAMALDIDVTTAVLDKVERNSTKYPVREYKGEYRRPEG